MACSDIFPIVMMTCVVSSFLILLTGTIGIQSRSVSGDNDSATPLPMEEALLEVLDGTNPQTESDDDDQKVLCPEGSAFHKETGKCYGLREKGPCGQLQVFYSLRDTPQYGDCSCMSNPSGCTADLKNGVSNRMILMGPDRKHCYMAFSKGPCKSGEWYILDNKSHKPQCQKNSCCKFTKQHKATALPISPSILNEIKSQLDVFTFISNGTCYRTFTQAFCDFGQHVRFHGTIDPVPKCYINGLPQFCALGVAPQVGMPCEAGYKLIGNECVWADLEFE